MAAFSAGLTPVMAATLLAAALFVVDGYKISSQHLDKPPSLWTKDDKLPSPWTKESQALASFMPRSELRAAKEEIRVAKKELRVAKKDFKGAMEGETSPSRKKDSEGEMGFEEPKPISKEELENDPARDAEKDMEKAVPTTLPPKVEAVDPENENGARSAAELTGVKMNSHGDRTTFFVTLSVNALIVAIALLTFSGLRLMLPDVFSGNVKSGIAPMRPSETLFGWASASWNTSIEMAIPAVGLDAALLLEYYNLCCRILATIGIPMVCIMCPLHFWFGGDGMGSNELSSIAMGNVMVHHPWMYYIHAIIINIVTVVVIKSTYAAMTRFQIYRFRWLKNMPSPRCHTILVEGIPQEWRSDEKLKEFFQHMFQPELVHAAVMVKDARELTTLYAELTSWNDLLRVAQNDWEASGFAEEAKPMVRERMCVGEKLDAISYYKEKVADLTAKVHSAREQAVEQAATIGGINTSAGFVTFTRRREAEVCINMIFSPERHEWMMSRPPPASDVRWEDLKMNEDSKKMYSLMAYLCVFGLYIGFIPLVLLGTNITTLIDMGYFQPLWTSFAPGLSLMLFLAFLPTLLLLVFRSFFPLKAEQFAQHKLQIWYFYFLLFFVILVTIVGKSLVGTFKEVAKRPGKILSLMAQFMPHATHFYMDYTMLSWGEQAMSLIRMVPLIKFVVFTKCFGIENPDAKVMSEPEDQDFYGIGSRSARFTINMLIGIIFSTLSPLIAMLNMILFALCRLVYGYLIVYAETKKPDLGGFFYHTQLEEMIKGTGIYNTLMIAVLLFRARTKFPMLIALPSLFYTIYSHFHFKKNYVWRELPFTELCFHEDELTAKDNGLRFRQPEFEPLADGDDKDTPRSVSMTPRNTDGHTYHLNPVFLGQHDQEEWKILRRNSTKTEVVQTRSGLVVGGKSPTATHSF